MDLMCFQILRQSTSGQIAKAMMPTGLHLKRLPYSSMIPRKTMIYMPFMMKSALLARGAPARSRHLSKIPLAHVVPHRVGVELPGTLERSSWAVEPWNVRGFFRDFPRNGTHFTGGESGVYEKIAGVWVLKWGSGTNQFLVT